MREATANGLYNEVSFSPDQQPLDKYRITMFQNPPNKSQVYFDMNYLEMDRFAVSVAFFAKLFVLFCYVGLNF